MLDVSIITFNVHNPRSHLITRVAQYLKKQGVDFIGLQEISKKASCQIAGFLGMNYKWRGCSCLGNCLLTRFSSDQVHFSSLLIDVDPGYETRSAICCKLQLQDRELVVASTHLDHIDENIRLKQWDHLREWLPQRTDIIMGDMNAINFTDYCKEALDKITEERKRDNWELPKEDLVSKIQKQGWCIGPYSRGTSRFDTRIDYVLSNTTSSTRLSDKVLKTDGLSDHQAILSLLKM